MIKNKTFRKHFLFPLVLIFFWCFLLSSLAADPTGSPPHHPGASRGAGADHTGQWGELWPPALRSAHSVPVGFLWALCIPIFVKWGGQLGVPRQQRGFQHWPPDCSFLVHPHLVFFVNTCYVFAPGWSYPLKTPLLSAHPPCLPIWDADLASSMALTLIPCLESSPACWNGKRRWGPAPVIVTSQVLHSSTGLQA